MGEEGWVAEVAGVGGGAEGAGGGGTGAAGVVGEDDGGGGRAGGETVGEVGKVSDDACLADCGGGAGGADVRARFAFSFGRVGGDGACCGALVFGEVVSGEAGSAVGGDALAGFAGREAPDAAHVFGVGVQPVGAGLYAGL